MKKVEIAGRSFTVVNELEETIMKKVIESVVTYYEGQDRAKWRRVENVLELIGAGHCGAVFEISKEIAIKFDKGTMTNDTKDGEVLHSLQHVSMIPKLYMYSDDGNVTIVQRIDGMDIREYRHKHRRFSLLNWDSKQVMKDIEIATNCMFDAGWMPTDLHNENCMVDVNGKFWVVDVGIFDRLEGWSKASYDRDPKGKRRNIQGQLEGHVKAIEGEHKKVEPKKVVCVTSSHPLDGVAVANNGKIVKFASMKVMYSSDVCSFYCQYDSQYRYNF